MIGQLIASFKKSRIRGISKKLSEPLDFSSFNVVLKKQVEHKKAVDELFTLCMDGSVRLELMRRYGLERKDLEIRHSNLSLQGASQWAGGHYVSASSLVYAQTLDYLFQLYTSEYGTDMNNWATAAYRLIEYFRKGETGRVYN